MKVGHILYGKLINASFLMIILISKTINAKAFSTSGKVLCFYFTENLFLSFGVPVSRLLCLNLIHNSIKSQCSRKERVTEIIQEYLSTLSLFLHKNPSYDHSLEPSCSDRSNEGSLHRLSVRSKKISESSFNSNLSISFGNFL